MTQSRHRRPRFLDNNLNFKNLNFKAQPECVRRVQLLAKRQFNARRLTCLKETSAVEASGNKLELPLDIRATAFQRRVWEALLEIPAGTIVTYSEKAPAEAGALHFLRQQSQPSLSSSNNTPAP